MNDKDCRDNFKKKINQLCAVCTKKVLFAQSLLNHSYWNTEDSLRHHEARLICLNKVFPKIPDLEQYRPIVVASPVIKFLEGYLTPSLNLWMRSSMTKNGYGFRPGRSIEDARLFALKTLTEHRVNKRPVYAIFFDISSAYDNVDRKLLRKLLREFKVWQEDQIMLWEWIVTNQQIRIGNERAHCTNGLPQGSPASPGLWNVYMQPLALDYDKLDKEISCSITFADDLLALTTDIETAKLMISLFEKWCR